jgi:hypothetical protein
MRYHTICRDGSKEGFAGTFHNYGEILAFTMISWRLGTRTLTTNNIWYAEAPALQGPWTTTKKIVTHDNYTFYNPAHDEFFNKDGGRIIYFEGTYTNTLTDRTPISPYNYKQMMYRRPRRVCELFPWSFRDGRHIEGR